MTIRTLVCVAVLALLAACGPDENNGNNGSTNGETNGETNGATNGGTNGDTNGGGVSFEMDIAPLIDSNCNVAGCHASPGQKNFVIEGDTPADIATALDGVASEAGPNLVEPSDAAQSEVYIRVSGMARTQMPLGGQLSDDDIQLIEDWIDAGAPFDS